MSVKQQLLTALLQSKGEFISGQKLAQLLNVSRNAVWKAAVSLRTEGYAIDAVTHKGYRLLAAGDLLDTGQIRACLKPKYQDLPILIYDSIDSTNEEAKRLLANGLTGRALIIANGQSQGKGRQGRSFCSPAGQGLYLSLVIQPHSDLAQAVATTTMAAVAVTAAIETAAGISPQIKWVNDLYLDGKKICGILTEAVTDFESGQVQSVIIGIGINTAPTALPPELREIAGALPNATDQRNQLAAEIVNQLLPLTEHPQDKSYLESYRSHSLVIGQQITYYLRGEVYRAKALGIDDSGGLIVKKDDGVIDILTSGEISLRVCG